MIPSFLLKEALVDRHTYYVGWDSSSSSVSPTASGNACTWKSKQLPHTHGNALFQHVLRFALCRPYFVLPTVSKNAPARMKTAQPVCNVPPRVPCSTSSAARRESSQIGSPTPQKRRPALFFKPSTDQVESRPTGGTALPACPACHLAACSGAHWRVKLTSDGRKTSTHLADTHRGYLPIRQTPRPSRINERHAG